MCTDRQRHERLLINLTRGVNEKALPCQIYHVYFNTEVGPLQIAEVKYRKAHNSTSHFFVIQAVPPCDSIH